MDVELALMTQPKAKTAGTVPGMGVSTHTRASELQIPRPDCHTETSIV